MRLIQSIIDNEWEKNIKDYVNRLADCMDKRISWMEERELEYDGAVHDTWQEKYDELSNIYDEINCLLESYDDKSELEIKQAVSEICDQIYTYQCVYGGLSRIIL